VSHCGHRCCTIADNAYHRHLDPPPTCPQCARAYHQNESGLLGRIVNDVLIRVAPEIPGLPTGAELAELVASHALAVYAAALVDPDVRALDERSRRTVLAARVGLALAFP
jgi:hypothetical protein